VGGGYFLWENLSAMHIISLTKATTKVIAKNIITITSYTDMASPPFGSELSQPQCFLIALPGDYTTN